MDLREGFGDLCSLEFAVSVVGLASCGVKVSSSSSLGTTGFDRLIVFVWCVSDRVCG